MADTLTAATDLCGATHPTGDTICHRIDGHETHTDDHGSTWTTNMPPPEPAYIKVRQRIGRALAAARKRTNGMPYDEQDLADAAPDGPILLAAIDNLLRKYADLQAEVLLLREALDRLDRAAVEEAMHRCPRCGSMAVLGRLDVCTGCEAAPELRPRIVCLCGSTRFADAYREANLRETVAGRIVLSIGCDLRTDHELWPEQAERERLKAALDELHRRKIDLCDEVLVLNCGGYIGDSTRSKIEYAQAHGKAIRYLEPIPVGVP